MRCLLAVLALALAAAAAEVEYRSASEGKDGYLHIVRVDGKEEVVRKVKDQTSFGAPAISPDGRTVGWLVKYANPDASYDIGGALVLHRAGRVLHRFTTEQVFWDWKFQDGGRRVAYCTGPTHGGAAECLLRDVDSGRVDARWDPKSGGDPPAWAEKLHQ